jgi:hypothetical protein
VSSATLYAELAAETPGAPLCRVCRRVDLFGCPTGFRSAVGDGVCPNCFELGLDDPEWREAWRNRHCADCGCYLDTVWTVVGDVPGGAILVCVDHYAERMGMHVVWRGDTHLGDVAVVDQLPPRIKCLDPFPWTLEKLFRLRNRYIERGEWPPADAPTVIYDQLVAEFEAAA